MPADGYVEMWTGGSSSASAEPDLLSTLHDVAFLHFEFREVKIERQESLAVVDDHAISLEIEKPGEKHGPVVHRSDRSSGGNAVVESEVRTLGDSVEDALRSEDVRSGGIDWGCEVALPFAVGRDPAEVVLLDFDSFGDLRLLLGAGLREFLLDRELNFDLGILRSRDSEGATEGDWRVVCGTYTFQFERVFARVGFNAYSCESEPRFG